MRWIYVLLPYATFALGVRDGQVVMAPPMARKFMGRPERVVAEWYRSQGATFTDLPD